MRNTIVNIFLFIPCLLYAFQQDNELSVLDKAFKDLELSVQLNQLINPIDSLLSFKDQCVDAKRNDLAYNCYTNISTLIIYDPGVVDKIAFLDQIIAKEKILDLDPIKQATLAHLSAMNGDYASLETYYFQAIKELQRYQLNTSILSLQQNIAIELTYLGNFKEALYYALKARDLLNNKLDNNSDLAINLNEILKLIYNQTGQFDLAVKYTHKNLLLYKEDPAAYQEYITFSYSNLSVLYNQLNDYDNALQYGLKAAKEFKSSGTWTQGFIFNNNYNLAGIYLDSKQFEEALFYFRENLNMRTNTIPPKDQTDNILLLAKLFIQINEPDSALLYLDQCNTLENKYGHVEFVRLLYMGDVARLKGDAKKSESYYRSCLDLPIDANFIATRAKIGLIELYKDRQRYQDCLPIIQSSFEDLSPSFDPDLVANPAIDDLVKLPLALEVFKLKMSIYSKLLEKKQNLQLIRDIDNTLLLSGQCLDKLNRQLSSNDSKMFWMNKWAIPAYEDALLLCHKAFEITGDQSFNIRAFELAEKGKSMLLSESIQKKIASQVSNIPDSLLLLESTLNYNIESLKQKITKAKRDRNEKLSAELEQQLFEFKHQLNSLKLFYKSEYKKYYALKFENDVVPISYIQNKLGPNEILIEYFEGNENLFIFIIDKNTYRFIRKEIQSDYGFAIDKFMALITQTTLKKDQFVLDYNQYCELAFRLYEQFTDKDLRKNIASYQKMCVIHHGKMSYIPFDLLVQSSVEKAKQIQDANYANLPLVLKNLIINYHLSASMKFESTSNEKETTSSNTPSIVAFSPQYQPDQYADCRGKESCDLRRTLRMLKGAKMECQFLKDQYGASIFEDEQASESQFRERASKASILHLAMHGIINNELSDLSGLVFSDIVNDDSTSTTKLDNILHSYEIRNLDLPADLVVLSACQTGNGVYQKGEGIMSMGRGFMYAGTRSLLMSLWNLNDMAGYQIIKDFYLNIDKGWSKDRSLTESKRTFLSQCENAYQTHPIFWASLSLIGDESPIVVPKRTPFPWWIGMFVFLLVPIGIVLRKRK